ncbi:acyltransferase family protein [Bradyrhizobium manausense]|uniref:acyltransferase family protein n=1 Tax=Bradyrhizobium manausense TaxID=989370 RepID=UPI001FD9016D|nr:acyltransferase [Bradyrhizobium manausense]
MRNAMLKSSYDLPNLPHPNAFPEDPGSLAAKEVARLSILDGMRGIAAICVTFLHFYEPFQSGTQNWIPRGYLAVDFFFCLSGYVMAFAYDPSRVELSPTELIKRRLIRLHPLVVISSLLGFAVVVTGRFYSPMAAGLFNFSVTEFFILLTCSALLLPHLFLSNASFPIFPLAAPAWSLLCEYVASLTFALFLRQLSLRWLVAMLAFAAVATAYTCYDFGSLNGGFDRRTFWIGFVRVGFSFIAGVVAYRIGRQPRLPRAESYLPLILLATFFWPFLWRPYDFLIVTIVYPLLVWLGANAIGSPSINRFSEFIGDLSYPLYMTHYVLLMLLFGATSAGWVAQNHATLAVPTMTLVAIAFAFLVKRYLDEPIRASAKGRLV